MFGGGYGFRGWVVILAHWVVAMVGEEKRFDRGEKIILKTVCTMNSNRVYIHGYCSFCKTSCIFRHFYMN